MTMMKSKLAVLTVLLPLAGAVFAQNDPITGIAESTDPAKVAEVERRAQEIMSHQQAGTSGASNASGTSATSDTSQKKQHKGKKSKKQKANKDDQGAASSSSDSGSASQR
jgi:hypothetical protein